MTPLKYIYSFKSQIDRKNIVNIVDELQSLILNVLKYKLMFNSLTINGIL